MEIRSAFLIIDSEFIVCEFLIDSFAEIIWDSIEKSKVMNKILPSTRSTLSSKCIFLVL